MRGECGLSGLLLPSRGISAWPEKRRDRGEKRKRGQVPEQLQLEDWSIVSVRY